ncbi:MAG: flagellar basal body L-ring protein FlgH [Phycisphaerales bacterium]|nr:flagellar basal body L-ring protein FlgH [Phycisphaerales bacterium]
MNPTRSICCVPLLMATAATANITGGGHLSPHHMTSSSHHLSGIGPAPLTTGLGGLNASLNSNLGLMQANMNGQLNTLGGYGWNAFGAWNTMPAMMPMYQPMMPMPMGNMVPMASISATELSPLASAPIMPMMPMPVTPISTPSMSYMSQAINGPWGSVLLDDQGMPITNQLESTSLFAFSPEKPRLFTEHDLVQIVVRETTRIASFQGLETEKEYGLVGGVEYFPGLNNNDLLNYTEVELMGEKEFEGEGEYAREDDLTTRLTAEIIEILPNGNLVLEARTRIKTDDEEMFTQLTGVCRPDDVTASNTILSNQIFNLEIEKMHYGEVREAANKGILAKILDAVFAF